MRSSVKAMGRVGALWPLLLLWSSAAGAQDLLLTGGKLVDPRSRSVTQQSLTIEDGVITGRSIEVPADFSGRVLDITGKWIIPGLHDMHTHTVMQMAPVGVRELVGTEKAARRMLFSGVTGFLDLFNTEKVIFATRDRQRASTAPAEADIFAAGPCFTATSGHCTQFFGPARIIDTPAQARQQIADLASARPDVVKLVYAHGEGAPPTIDRATLEAAIGAAKEAWATHGRAYRDLE